jgi:SARP family transcriptional regulator, regulator of embCAB operon
MSIRVYLTGPLAIEVNGNTVVEERSFRGRQSRLAFAYLVVERTRPVGREEIAEVLWPGEMPPAWTGALSALISRLKGLLTTAGLDASGMFISSDFGLYRLILPGDAWVDVEAATAGIDRAEAALRIGDTARVLGPATITSNICRRPFLADCDGDWVESLRSKLARQLVRALEIHTRMWLASGEAILAVETAVEATTLDPFRETAYQLLMRAYVASGNPAQASCTYQRLQALLLEELDAAPSSETRALYHQLSSS